MDTYLELTSTTDATKKFVLNANQIIRFNETPNGTVVIYHEGGVSRQVEVSETYADISTALSVVTP